MSTMKDLARIVADRYDLPRQESEEFISEMFALLKNGLTTDEQVKIKGLGTFKIQKMQERKSVDVNTGEQIMIDSHDRISFTPDNSMKESVNKPFAHFETVIINEGVVFDDLEGVTEEPKQETPQPTVQKEAVPVAQPQPVLHVEPVVQPEAVTVVEPEPTVQPEAVAVVEPEPVVQSEVVAVTEPEPVVQSEVVAVTEPEPVVQSEVVAVTEPEPIVLPKAVALVSEPVESESAPSTSQPKQTILIDNTYNNPVSDMEYNSENFNPSKYERISTTLTVFLLLLMLIIGFAIGRATSDITIDDVIEYIHPTKKVVKDDIEFTTIDGASIIDSESQQKDTDAVDSKTAEQKAAAEKAIERAQLQKAAVEKAAAMKKEAEATKAAEAAKKAAAAKAEEAKATAAKQAATPSSVVDASKYDSDPRIRYGAYRIVGVQKTVTVKEGQTLSSIAKANLGPGMECYIEAINGVKTVQAGQKIKIPELKIKKKASAQ